MDTMPFVDIFSRYGQLLLIILLVLSGVVTVMGAVNICSSKQVALRPSKMLLVSINILFLIGFALICWFHYQIYQHLPLVLPDNLAGWINKQISTMNAQAAYTFPLYDANNPPRYAIPLWIDNEKYFFWFMTYAFMSLIAFCRMASHRIQGTLMVFLGIQTGIVYFFANPFVDPLPKFFTEIGPWFNGGMTAMQQFGAFMQLYPKMIFYYNASYMWMHPPMLFLSYACITITFITSVFMLIRREPAIEALGYDFAKFGYFMLTLGMLLGYPWALKAWGPNWWWDPKICSSIMMWAIYSTYLHTRLYANKKSMWYFTSFLGILCFLSMLFTFVSSFYFPGEHTFQ